MRAYSILSGVVLSALAGSVFATDSQVALNYNFNGMVHPGEVGFADSIGPSWYRSIADRGLAIDGTSGTLTHALNSAPIVGATGLTYSINTTPFTLDIVMLGNRNLNAAWDLTVDGDNRGVRPDWLVNDDQRGPQTTTLAAPIALDAYAEIGVLYEISNVGASTATSTFTVTLGFTDSDPVTVTVTGRDWFGSRPALAPAANSGLSSQTQLGVYKGCNNGDIGTISEDAGQTLNVWEAVIDVRKLLLAGLGDFNGKHLSTITFQYPVVVPAGNREYAIFATTVRTDSTPAVNGTCDTAITIPAGGGTIAANNNRAPSSDGSCGTFDDAGVWYRYDATTNHTIQARTCGSAIDTTLTVYDGCAGEVVVCNDNACGTGSIVEWTGVPGHAYMIRVAGSNHANGNFTLSLDDPIHPHQPVALNYNFNGLVHGVDEQNQTNVDNPNGYRSIADRGIILGSGEIDSIDATPLVDVDGMGYSLVTEAGELDIVHLGNRNLVANQSHVYGADPTSGQQPSWQTDPDQTGPQATDLSSRHYVLGANSRLGVIYQISDSGGSFDTTLNFTDSTSATVTLRAPDWFNSQTVPAPTAGSGLIAQRQLGVYAATDSTDIANLSTNNLNVVEAVTSVAQLAADNLGSHAGKEVSSIVFSNPVSNANYPFSTPATGAGFAILGATFRDITVAPQCPADLGMAGGLPGQDGLLNNNDFIAFITYFFNTDPHADVGIAGGLTGSDGHWDNNDFIAFITLFFNGCN